MTNEDCKLINHIYAGGSTDVQNRLLNILFAVKSVVRQSSRSANNEDKILWTGALRHLKQAEYCILDVKSDPIIPKCPLPER